MLVFSLAPAPLCEVFPKQFSAMTGIRSKQLVDHAAGFVILTLPVWLHLYPYLLTSTYIQMNLPASIYVYNKSQEPGHATALPAKPVEAVP